MCGACGPFIKKKERIKRFKGTGNWRYVYQNELDKPFFQHDMVYGDFKNLAKVEKQLLIKYYGKKLLILLKIKNMLHIKVDLLHWSISFLMKKTSGGTAENKNISNE